MPRPTLPHDAVCILKIVGQFRECAWQEKYCLAQIYHSQARVAIDNFVADINNDQATRTKWNCLAAELDTEMDIVRDIIEEMAEIASFIRNPSPAEGRRSSRGNAFTSGEEGDLSAVHAIRRKRRIAGGRTPGVVGGVDRLLPPHRDAVGTGYLGDNDSPATTDDDVFAADHDFDPFQVEVDSDPSQSSDPDVWPLPTPKPLRGSLQVAPEAATAAAESSSYRSRGNYVSRSKRESAAAAAALAAEQARQSLPVWTRLTSPPRPVGGSQA